MFDNPPPSPVIRPVVVIVFDPNAPIRVTTFESPYVPAATSAGVNVNTPVPLSYAKAPPDAAAVVVVDKAALLLPSV